ncbi:MAG: CHAT domain-containing tetratricopeptide repeat protein [Candidatus Eisenbacteria bacterium]
MPPFMSDLLRPACGDRPGAPRRFRSSGRVRTALLAFAAAAVLAAPAGGDEGGDHSVRGLQDLLQRGRLQEAEAGAARFLEASRPGSRADSLDVFDAARVLVEARMRLGRFEDPSLPELVESLLSMGSSLLDPDAVALAHAHQFAGYLARSRGDREGELGHLQAALDIVERSDPPDHAERVKALGNMAGARFRAGDPSGARELLQGALGVLEEHLSPEHFDVAATLINLSEARIALGDTAGIGEAYARAVTVYERYEGAEGLRVADALQRLGAWRFRTGDTAGAARTLDRALAILGLRDPGGERLAASLLARAKVHMASMELDSAAARSARALDIYEKRRGPETGEAAACLVALGDAERHAWRHEEARENYRKALEILESSPKGDPWGLADCLQALASHSLELGRYDDAVGYARRRLELIMHGGGFDHRAAALARLDYGAALLSAQRPDSASAHFERARTDLEASVDPGDPVLAEPCLRLAALARERGDFPRALAHAERALASLERAYGADDSRLSEGLHELAIVQRRLGDEAGARASIARALRLASSERAQSLPVAGILSSLATLERASGDTASAAAHFREALGVLERVLPDGHPESALVLRNLASLENAGGRFAAAEALYRAALDILERSVGPRHADVAAAHLGLGNALKGLGKMEEARAHYELAIETHLGLLGPEAPALALDYHNLAALLLELGELETAMEKAEEAERLGRQHFRLVLQGATEREALHYSGERVSGTDIVLTAAARSDSPADWERAWDLVIRSRAAIIEEIAARRRFLASTIDSNIVELAHELESASNRLAYLAVRGRGSESLETYRALLENARREKEGAERNLAGASRQFEAQESVRNAGEPEVLAALPPGSALVAWVRFERMERPAGKGEGASAPPAAGNPAYGAFVVDRGEPPIRFVSLGDAGRIDSLVAQWHENAGTGVRTRGRDAADASYRESGEALRRAVWDPVAAGLESRDRIFLVPDGALTLLNFDTLPHPSGGYLLEHLPLLHVLSSERDLTRTGTRPPSGEGLLITAAPDYETDPPSPPDDPERQRSAERGIPCAQFKSLWFLPLPGTAEEKKEVIRLWSEFGRASGKGGPEVYELDGPNATEREFRRLARGREVLHIATHGFFLGAECAGRPATGGAAPRDELTVGGIVAESPLLLSGLAFAGANLREDAPSSETDGVLTAEEITTMNLEGTDLVVLSACETGLGKVEAGEGVFGLRRAFQIAGARNLVMSLWSVDDEATAAWMKTMFDYRLRGGLSPAEAVRAASVDILKRRRAEGLTTHPYYWGAFIVTGDWR